MKVSSPVKRRHSRIEIIPLIDIMFFLLASFMMVSLQLDRTKNIAVALPPAESAKADFKPDMINIAVDRRGAIWIEKKEVTPAALNAELAARFHASTNLPVYISGDAATKHGAMVKVLEIVRNAGIQKVAFMTGSATNQGTP